MAGLATGSDWKRWAKFAIPNNDSKIKQILSFFLAEYKLFDLLIWNYQKKRKPSSIGLHWDILTSRSSPSLFGQVKSTTCSLKHHMKNPWTIMGGKESIFKWKCWKRICNGKVVEVKTQAIKEHVKSLYMYYLNSNKIVCNANHSNNINK